MSYIINKTDGSILTEIVDGNIDQTASDITLIGKNSNSYGEFLNENFVHLLENFANISAPENPILGQLWYDSGDGRLKVYDGSGFKVSGGTILSPIVPSSISQGDLWIDSKRRQLYFNDGVSTMLVGPIYAEDQGISGFRTTDILDTSNNNRTIVSMYVANTLIGIFSNAAFTPATTIPGFNGTIEIGFNVSTYNGIKFHAPVTQADALLDSLGNLRTAEDFIISANDSSMQGTLTIQNDKPFVLGTNSENEVLVDSNIFKINSNRADQNFAINVLHNAQLRPSFFVNTINEYVGIYTDTPAATLDVNGDAVIRGNLNVTGDITTINTTNLEIQDKLIELSKTEEPTNDTADGSGFLVVAGLDGDKEFAWNKDDLSWNSSESINIASGKTYKINGFDILSSTSLGAGIISAPGLETIGTLTSLQVDNININGSTISYLNINNNDGDIVISPKGIGVVDVSSSKITNLANATSGTDAVNLNTLTEIVKAVSLAVSLEVTGLTNEQISGKLSVIFPVGEYSTDTICRVVCTDGGIVTVREFSIVSNVWTWTGSSTPL